MEIEIGGRLGRAREGWAGSMSIGITVAGAIGMRAITTLTRDLILTLILLLRLITGTLVRSEGDYLARGRMEAEDGLDLSTIASIVRGGAGSGDVDENFRRFHDMAGREGGIQETEWLL